MPSSSAFCGRSTWAAPSCFAPDVPVLGSPCLRLLLAACARTRLGLPFSASPRAPPRRCSAASPRARPRGCSTSSPHPCPHVCISVSPWPCPHPPFSASPRPRPPRCFAASPRPRPPGHLCGSPWRLLLVLPRTFQSGGRPPALVPGCFSHGGGDSYCLAHPRRSSPGRLALLVLSCSCPGGGGPSFRAGSGKLASRARFGAPHLFLGPLCLSVLLGSLRAGVAPFLVLCWPSPCFSFPSLFFLLRAPPFVFRFHPFPARGALGLGAFFFFPPPPRPVVISLRPLGLWLSLVSAWGALGLGAVCCLFCWPPTSRLSVRSRLLCVSRPAVGCSLVVAVPPPFLVSRFLLLAFGARFSSSLCAPVVSGFRWFPAPRALGLGAVGFFLCGPSASLLSVRCCLVCVSRLAVGCSLVVAAPPPGPLFGALFSSLGAPFFVFFSAVSFLRCPCPCCLWLSLVSCPGCPWPWRFVLFFFCGLPLLGSLCALASFVFPAWPLAAPWWLLYPPPLSCLTVFVATSRSGFFFRAPPCLWLSLVPGPGCPGPWRCVLFVLLASRFSARCALSPL